MNSIENKNKDSKTLFNQSGDIVTGAWLLAQ
jgi:hypothetical protein